MAIFTIQSTEQNCCGIIYIAMVVHEETLITTSGSVPFRSVLFLTVPGFPASLHGLTLGSRKQILGHDPGEIPECSRNSHGCGQAVTLSVHLARHNSDCSCFTSPGHPQLNLLIS